MRELTRQRFFPIVGLPVNRKQDLTPRSPSAAFHAENGTSIVQIMTDLQAAVDHIPQSEHTPEAKSLFEALQPSTRRQQTGLRRLGEILPGVLAKLGVTAVELNSKGENDLT